MQPVINWRNAATQVLPRVFEFGFCVIPKGILFAKGEGIEYLQFETGKISPFCQPAGKMTVGLSLSSHQRHLLFPQRESSVSDLMLVENFPETP